MIWARELERVNVTCNAICPMARTRMTTTSGYFAEVPAEGQFDEYAPENISPLVIYLASDQAQDITGRVLSIRGGILELFEPWRLAKSIDLKRRWSVKEIGERIHELGDLSMPKMDL